jgi:predicted alpha/beta-fold hydrolase
MKYRPWIFAANSHTHAVFCMVLELCWKIRGGIPEYRKEIFECNDGGTILLEWLVHASDKGLPENSKRPILILVPGIAGDSSLLYCQTIAYACMKNDFDLLIVNYQGLGAIPLTVSIFILFKTNLIMCAETLLIQRG